MKPFFDDVAFPAHWIRKTSGIGDGRVEAHLSRATQENCRAEGAAPCAAKAAKSARHRSDHIDVDRQENRASIHRNAFLYNVLARGPRRDPRRKRARTLAHWSIENNLRWRSEIAFDEDCRRSKMDFSPLNLAAVRHMVLDIRKRDGAKMFLKRDRVKAAVNSPFRAELPAC